MYAAWLVFFYRYHWVDGINLLIHEAGHLIFSPLARLSGGGEIPVGLGAAPAGPSETVPGLGETLTVLGGPLLQLAVPLFITHRLWRRGESTPAAVAALWSAESLMHTAEYMSDANRLALPPLGAHPNDWTLLLHRAGALDAAEEIGLALHLLASAAIAAIVWHTLRHEPT